MSAVQLRRHSVLIRPCQNLSTKMRLFAFPHAGGGPSEFIAWANRFKPDCELICIQLPGRGSNIRDTPYLELKTIVHEVADAICPFVSEPFAFIGHSFGALVAFELARLLRRTGGGGPEHLFVSAARAPHLGLPHDPLHKLSDADFITALHSHYGGLPPAVTREQELLQLLLPAIRADLTAYETYVYQAEPPLDCSITAFAGAQDATATAEATAQWSIHTGAEFEMNVLPGDHFFLETNRDFLIPAIAGTLRISSTGGTVENVRRDDSGTTKLYL